MKHNVVVVRVFDDLLQKVWKAWVDPKLVMQWWGPTGFTSPSAKMDFREGGTSLVCMRAPKEFGGKDMYNTWTYTKIVPNERIEYILRFSNEDGETLDPSSHGLPPTIPKEVRNVNVFKDLGNGKTELTITEYGYASEQDRDMSKAGLEQCLDKMAAILR